MNLIKLPYDSVSKMIEHVHFNKKNPKIEILKLQIKRKEL